MDVRPSRIQTGRNVCIKSIAFIPSVEPRHGRLPKYFRLHQRTYERLQASGSLCQEKRWNRVKTRQPRPNLIEPEYISRHIHGRPSSKRRRKNHPTSNQPRQPSWQPRPKSNYPWHGIGDLPHTRQWRRSTFLRRASHRIGEIIESTKETRRPSLTESLCAIGPPSI